MALATGIALGPYEILSPLGAGGMGEVYRARDTRLGRDVAIKILSSSFVKDQELLRRFEQEARAAGILNHPNILVIYDIGRHDESPYVVSELLEGETLRERLNNRSILQRKAIDYALQIAHGLTAAHEKGIVHRDLKPENIFITKDGRVKILDFGLAKLTHPYFAASLQTEAPTMRNKTEPGAIMGTVGYMSPEQVRGLTIDHRSDIFSFGIILFEMLVGKRPFQCESAVETMNSILKDDPPELAATSRAISPALEQIVEHCLEKKPEDRFQSVKDLIFALDALSSITSSFSIPPQSLVTTDTQPLVTVPHAQTTVTAQPSPRRRGLIIALILLMLAANIAIFFVGRSTVKSSQPTFHRLTFRRGVIHLARFAADNHTIVYDASWEGRSMEVFTTRPESPESRSLDLPEGSLIYSISSTGELAISLREGRLWGDNSGTFARVPLAGGAPRQIQENVQAVEWSPDGNNNLIAKFNAGQTQFEYPAGKVIYKSVGIAAYPRISPDGQKIAFMEWPELSDSNSDGSVVVIDLAGNRKVLYTGWLRLSGLTWSPKGDEVWFAAPEVGGARTIYGVSLTGQKRLVLRMPGALTLHDVAADGRILLTREHTRVEMFGQPPLSPEWRETSQAKVNREQHFSWLDESSLADLSDDGQTILFTEIGEGGGGTYTVYLRKTDGSPAVRLGAGRATALSPDGKWALAIQDQAPRQLIMLPTGPGQTKTFQDNRFEQYFNANWFPDGQHIIFTAAEKGQGRGTYIYDLASGQVKQILSPGVIGTIISYDGKSVLAVDNTGLRGSYSIETGQRREIQGLDNRERMLRWSKDGNSIYISRLEGYNIKVFRLNIETGARELWHEFMPPDPAGVNAYLNLSISPEADAYVFSYRRLLADLFLIEGVN